jgi:Tol biopolymer transport system component
VLLPADISLNDMIVPISRLSISRDGRQIAFSGRNRTTGQTQIYRIPLDSGVATPVAGTKDGISPMWSPDGAQLIFSDFTKLLRVPVEGGAPVAIADVNVGSQRGFWGDNGVVLVGGVDVAPAHAAR